MVKTTNQIRMAMGAIESKLIYGLGNYQVRPLALRNRSFDPTSLGKTVGFIGGYKGLASSWV
jgi:hypothetical protein